MATPPAPFDPNAALRDFNQYFGTLRKQYGSDGLRNMGFTPRDLAALQASLRKLQMDPTATPEQHSAALREAMGTLGQRLTPPSTVAPTPQPVAGANLQLQPDGSWRNMTPEEVDAFRQRLASQMTPGVAPQPAAPAPIPQVEPPRQVTPVPPEIVTALPPTPPASNPVSNFIANMNAPAAAPAAQPSMNTQPGADFDRNIFTRMLNDQFSQLRQKYGDAGLRSAGFTPSTLAGLQGNLRRLSMDPSSTYDQNSAALEAALASMNGYFSPGAGQTGGQQVVPQPTPMPQPGPMPPPMPQPMAQPMTVQPPTNVGGPSPVAPPELQSLFQSATNQINGRPDNYAPPAAAPIPGMYRGGFAVKR